jgi:nucleolar protein 56
MIDRLMTLLPQAQQPQPDLRALAKACGFVRDDQEYNHLLRQVAVGLVRRRLESLVAEEEVLQMIDALDDLNYAVNLLDERLYEWSRLHSEETVRGRALAEALQGQVPMGELARALLYLRGSRQRLEGELESSISRLAPNLSDLAGPLLAARLVSRAGSLKRLSEMPSSAIQLLGAERSLFKHLKGRAPSPKHGIIYRHPRVSGAPRRLRGRAARALSGKLAIAARIDYYRGSLAPELKESLDKRLEEIVRAGRGE